VWHRRAGKDVVDVNIMALKAMTDRPGSYYYLYPTYAQARKAIWNGRMADGTRLLSCFPDWAIDKVVDDEMIIHLTNGSSFQLIGGANKDSLMGTNPLGVTFSEYSLHKDDLWDYIRPILVENGGWANFNGTPRGLNHQYRLYESVKDNPKWHVELRTVLDTFDIQGNRIVNDQMIEDERNAGMDEATIQQEFYCDWYAATSGAYYGDQMRFIQSNGRVTSVPYDPNLPLYTGWDIGYGDRTAIWFAQPYRNELRIIRYYEAEGYGIDHYAAYLHSLSDKFNYVYEKHFFPHDAASGSFQTGTTTVQQAKQYGIPTRKINVVPRTSNIKTDIDVCRVMLTRTWFDGELCHDGLEALRQYKKKETSMKDMHGRTIYAEKPDHDGPTGWASHGSDALRTLIVGLGMTEAGRMTPYQGKIQRSAVVQYRGA
jgi:hypothetical protein